MENSYELGSSQMQSVEPIHLRSKSDRIYK